MKSLETTPRLHTVHGSRILKSSGSSPKPTKKRARLTSPSNTQNSLDTEAIRSNQDDLSIQAYIENVFYGEVIQDDEDIFELTIERNFSRKLNDFNDGVHINFDGLVSLMKSLRSTLLNRRVISSTCPIVSLADPEGLTGTVLHLAKVSAVLEGQNVILDSAVVLQVALDHGKRTIIMESFTHTVTAAPPTPVTIPLLQ